YASEDRPLRAERLLPAPYHAVRPAAVQGCLPRLACLARQSPRRLAGGLSRGKQERIRPRDGQALARKLSPALLWLQPIQAQRDSEWTESFDRRCAQPARRLACAERCRRRCVARRTTGKSARLISAIVPSKSSVRLTLAPRRRNFLSPARGRESPRARRSGG